MHRILVKRRLRSTVVNPPVIHNLPEPRQPPLDRRSFLTAALGRSADGWHVVNVLDARTGGQETMAHHLVHATSRPAACPDEAPAFCFRGYLPDGAATVPSAGTVFPCSVDRDWVKFSHLEDQTYRAGSGHYPCDATTAEVPEWTPESLRIAAHEAGEIYVVSGPTGLAGFRSLG